MEDKKEEDQYHNLSRKDLQRLCTNYGLAANMTKSEMEASLMLDLERKSLSLKAVCQETESYCLPLSTSKMQPCERAKSIGRGGKGSRELMFLNGSGNGVHNSTQYLRQHHVQTHDRTITSHQTSRNVENLPKRLREDGNCGACHLENALLPPVSSTFEDPGTFQFDVSCDDGIQLYVDLNSSTPKWIDSVKGGVHLCHDAHKFKSKNSNQELRQSCSKEMESPFGNKMDSGHELSGSPAEDESCPDSFTREDRELHGEGSWSSSGNIVWDNSGKRPAILPPRYKSDMRRQNFCGVRPSKLDVTEVAQIKKSCNSAITSCSSKSPTLSKYKKLKPNTEICEKSRMLYTYSPANPSVGYNGCPATFSAETQVPVLPAQNQHLTRTSSVHSGLTSSLQFHRNANCKQPIKVADRRKNTSCFSSMHNGSLDLVDLENNVKSGHGKAVSLSEHFTELQIPSAGSSSKDTSLIFEHPHKVNGSMDVPNVKRNYAELVNTNGFVQEAVELETQLSAVGAQKRAASLYASINYESPGFVHMKEKSEVGHGVSTYSSELQRGYWKSQSNLERSETLSGMDSSECLDNEGLMEKACTRPAGSEFSGLLGRKRQYDDGGNHSKFVDPEAKFLRRQKPFAGEVHAKSTAIF